MDDPPPNVDHLVEWMRQAGQLPSGPGQTFDPAGTLSQVQEEAAMEGPGEAVVEGPEEAAVVGHVQLPPTPPSTPPPGYEGRNGWDQLPMGPNDDVPQNGMTTQSSCNFRTTHISCSNATTILLAQ
jgi:hypothetical protein